MMTQQELEKYLWGAATALRGTIDAGDYKQFIFPLVFYKRLYPSSFALLMKCQAELLVFLQRSKTKKQHNYLFLHIFMQNLNYIKTGN